MTFHEVQSFACLSLKSIARSDALVLCLSDTCLSRFELLNSVNYLGLGPNEHFNHVVEVLNEFLTIAVVIVALLGDVLDDIVHALVLPFEIINSLGVVLGFVVIEIAVVALKHHGACLHVLVHLNLNVEKQLVELDLELHIERSENHVLIQDSVLLQA